MSSPWKSATYYRILGYKIPAIKAAEGSPRKFYTELHKDGTYLASMGSDMPLMWLAVLETYLKRNRIRLD